MSEERGCLDLLVLMRSDEGVGRFLGGDEN